MDNIYESSAHLMAAHRMTAPLGELGVVYMSQQPVPPQQVNPNYRSRPVTPSTAIIERTMGGINPSFIDNMRPAEGEA